MHNIPVLKSKLTIPELTEKVVYTERLKSLNIVSHRGTLLTAPAGYGKTTAVLLALTATDCQVCWYRLEHEDSRFPIFIAHLTSTLFQRTADKNRIESFYIRSEPIKDYSLLNAIICQNAWSVFGATDDQPPVYLVLDDFHYAANQPEIIECVRYLFSNMPPCVHVIVASRIHSSLETGRTAINEKILLVGENELRFSMEEMRAYCEEKCGISAESDVFERMYNYSEGWIASIVMMNIAIKASEGIPLKSFFEKAEKSEIFNYFLTETLKYNDAETVRTLSQFAILDDFRPCDVSDIFDINDAECFIDLLMAKNLYLTKTSSNSGNAYRFHSLFRNALIALGRNIFGESGINELHVKAAKYYNQLGVFERAIHHYLAAGRVKDAADVLSINGDNMLSSGLTETVKMLVERFPEEYRETQPYLLLYYGITNKRADFDKALAYMEKAQRLFKEAGNTAMRVKALLNIIITCVYQNKMDTLKTVAQKLLSIPEAMEYEWCRISLMVLSFAKSTLSENFAEANHIYSALMHFKLDKEDLCVTYLNGCLLRHRQGDLDGALQILDKLFDLTLVKLDLNWLSFALRLKCSIYYLKGDFQELQVCVDELLELGEKYDHYYCKSHGKLHVALMKYLTHDSESAISYICSAQRDFTAFEDKSSACICRLYHYLWISGTKDSVDAGQIASVYNEIMALNPGLADDDNAGSLAGAALREAGEYEKAEEILLKSYNSSVFKGAKQFIAGTAFHLAKLYFNLNDSNKGMEYLKNALLISKENAYTAFYDLHFPTLVEMCARAISADIHSAYAKTLLEKYFVTAGIKYLARNAGAIRSTAAARNFIQRYNIANKAPQKDIAVNLLGGFEIIVDGESVSESFFKTRKISGILKYLLLNREQYVTRERLAGVFWPESDKKSALNSLRVALCEVRKTLSKLEISFESSAPLIVENELGFCIPKGAFKTDTDELLRMFNSMRSIAPTDDVKPVLSELLTLYKGDLLPHDYEDYIAIDREYLKSIFIESAYKMISILLSEQDYTGAEGIILRIIKSDPFNEKAYSILIDMYRSTGQNNRADSMLRQFEKRFEAEMEVKTNLKFVK